MGSTPIHPRRSQHAAMKDPGGSEYGERAGTGRGASSSDRLRSPPRVARRSPSSDPRYRHSSSRHDHASSKDDRRRSRDRSRDRSRQHRTESTRRGHEVEDLIPRYRAKKARHRDPDDDGPRRSRSRAGASRLNHLRGNDRSVITNRPDHLETVPEIQSRRGDIDAGLLTSAIAITIGIGLDLQAASLVPTDLLLHLKVPGRSLGGCLDRARYPDTIPHHGPNLREALVD
ncbi:hypothetical protein NOR_05974 [Metarhizium rileyi]|uniref:Uncharacterized protein n=1 Tax=Metarhizium rileyi (strain RCEF 4871) TaxID=1649241 RepID=A0A167BFB7_METRR|nr:hypothetical protein NOR_05974 [Metarhizium rileyi RCEF 4871]